MTLAEVPIDLSDSKALLARAQRHYREFEHLTAFHDLWHIGEKQDPQSGG
jgi:hypothetical protein